MENDHHTWGTGGGRLWKLAGEMAVLNAQSRAQPHVESPSRPHTSIVIPAEEAAPFLVRKTKKTGRHQTPLLVIGLVATFGGILGNFFVSSSCYFVSRTATRDSDTVHLHFGLWNYSPTDSSLNGYKSCMGYEQTRFANAAPIVPRVLSLLALFCAMVTLCTVWSYLIFSKIYHWRILAVYSGALSGTLQILAVLGIFFSRLCFRSGCGMGPAACIGLLYGVVWIMLSWEMQTYAPSTPDGAEEATKKSSTELSDLSSRPSMDLSKRSKLYTPPANKIST